MIKTSACWAVLFLFLIALALGMGEMCSRISCNNYFVTLRNVITRRCNNITSHDKINSTPMESVFLDGWLASSGKQLISLHEIVSSFPAPPVWSVVEASWSSYIIRATNITRWTDIYCASTAGEIDASYATMMILKASSWFETQNSDNFWVYVVYVVDKTLLNIHSQNT